MPGQKNEASPARILRAGPGCRLSLLRLEVGGDRVEHGGERATDGIDSHQDGDGDAGGDQAILSMAVAPDSSLTKRATEVLIFDTPLDFCFPGPLAALTMELDAEASIDALGTR